MARAPKPMHPIDHAVSQLLADAVERAGISRRELAEDAGMSTNRIGIILREERPASVGEAEVLAQALGLDAFDLFAEAERRATKSPPAGLIQRRPNVIEGRFARLGSNEPFAATAAALHSEVSILDEQEQQGD